MAGNSWWRGPNNSKDSKSPAAPYFRFQGGQPSSPDSPPESISNMAPPPGLPTRQTSKAARQSAGPTADASPAGTPSQPLSILRRPKQEDAAVSNSSASQGLTVTKGQPQRTVDPQSSPASNESPQGQGQNRKARRAHMQGQGASPTAQVHSLRMQLDSCNLTSAVCLFGELGCPEGSTACIHPCLG